MARLKPARLCRFTESTVKKAAIRSLDSASHFVFGMTSLMKRGNTVEQPQATVSQATDLLWTCLICC